MGFLADSNRNLQLRHCWEMLMPGGPLSHQQQPTMGSACRGTDLNVSMHAHACVHALLMLLLLISMCAHM